MNDDKAVDSSKSLEYLYRSREATKEFWERGWGSRNYDELVAFELYNHTFRATIDLFVEQNKIEDGHKVLEIGCGWGRIIIGLLKQFPNLEISGIDLSSEAITRAPALIERETSQSSIDLHITNAESLPFKDDTFDCVVSTRVFQYIADPTKAMREISRVLKPDGRVTICVPNKLNPVRYFSYHTQLLKSKDIVEWMNECKLDITSKGTILFLPPKLKRFSENSFWVSIDRFLAGMHGVNRFGGLAWASAVRALG